MEAGFRMHTRSGLSLLCVLGVSTLVGCDDDGGLVKNDAAVVQDAGAENDAGDAGDAGDADVSAPPFGGLSATTSASDFAIELFEHTGHRFWVEVNDTELERMNQAAGGGGVPIFAREYEVDGNSDANPIFAREFEIDGNGDIYSPGKSPTYADHVLIEDVQSGEVADLGKVEVKLVGESTFRPFTTVQIPNLRFDFDEFQMGQRVDSFEHVRLNNSQVGTIFREALAHRIFRALGYPALRSTHALLGTNVWGHDTWVPMTLMEVYKPRFCMDNEELIGGSCRNMWEFPGDPGEAVPAGACQWAECDDTRLRELRTKMRSTPLGDGFEAATSDFIDWPRMHQFQCLSWMLATGDDALHNGNNNLVIERDDGRLIWAPYSVDISAGQSWYPMVPLTGTSRVVRGCQLEPSCWAETIATCEGLIEKFDELEPEKMVEALVDTLTAAEMMRDGDMEAAMELRSWYANRREDLRGEIERYRYLPDALGQCPDGLEVCLDKTCGTSDECEVRLCGIAERFCEDIHACIPATEPCFSCDGADAVYCPITANCELSVAACSAACSEQLPGFIYCETTRECAPEWECNSSDDDGGVIGL